MIFEEKADMETKIGKQWRMCHCGSMYKEWGDALDFSEQGHYQRKVERFELSLEKVSQIDKAC